VQGGQFPVHASKLVVGGWSLDVQCNSFGNTRKLLDAPDF
jgi:hypothetical protein